MNRNPHTLVLMPQLVIPAAIKVEILGTIAGRECANVLGALNSGGAGATTAILLELANAVEASWKTGFLPLISDAYSYREVRCTSLNTATSPQVVVTNPGNGTKSNGSSSQVAQLIKLITETRSRSSRGRIYIPPPGDADVNSSGMMTNQQVIDLTAAMSSLRSSMATAGAPQAILSRFKSIAYPVTAFRVDTKVATQRRRLRG